MAYMSKEHVTTIRNNLKTNFPGFKFSVSNDNFSGVRVALLKSPLDFSKDLEEEKGTYIQVNDYYPERYSNSEVLKKIIGIINEGNHDNSDIQTDYFDVGFYVHFTIGQWNKPYVQIQ